MCFIDKAIDPSGLITHTFNEFFHRSRLTHPFSCYDPDIRLSHHQHASMLSRLSVKGALDLPTKYQVRTYHDQIEDENNKVTNTL